MSDGSLDASGDRRVRLERLRDLLADALELADVAVKAQLAGQYRATLKELAELPGKRRSKADELAARRRRQSTADQFPSSEVSGS